MCADAMGHADGWVCDAGRQLLVVRGGSGDEELCWELSGRKALRGSRAQQLVLWTGRVNEAVHAEAGDEAQAAVACVDPGGWCDEGRKQLAIVHDGSSGGQIWQNSRQRKCTVNNAAFVLASLPGRFAQKWNMEIGLDI
ncbi:hypothetical protein Taro_005695 [Colocasia esculenta]|uniref:Uncharacterized protein n=1 Tax=Colocasia esculenta TaxID=4460 RepID=A0A843TLN5_COLES|nr:hypothetical protein [Colocasia esculenta]